MRASLEDHEFDPTATVLADYLSRLDRGEAICRETFLAEHPEHADALREFFSDSDLIERFVGGESAASRDDTEATPREFGEYVLRGEIGRGGMGIVYRAREQSTGRLVALKMLLHSVLLSQAELQRFRNEARAAANVEHAGIMPIYHVGEHQGYLFYTMPLLRGGNLAQRLAGGPLEPRAAAKLMLVVAEAVAAAHQHRVVHRDLKPANILLDEQERPYVADFGLARCLGDETQGLTMTGDLLGTPNYMAPEQVNGRPALVGPSADVYAMGAVLYAMLVGQPPFQSETVSETLRKICDAEAPRPKQLRRSVPRDLETICLKCLEKSPTNRYESANQLAEDLRRFLAGEPLVAQRISRLERGRRWFLRNPLVGSLAVSIALALLAGTGFSIHYARQALEREQRALANLYAADMNLAQQHIRTGAVASALQLLERHRPEIPLPGSVGRGHQNSPPLGGEGLGEGGPWEWRYLWHQCHGELRRFEGPTGAVYAAAFSPDGRTVAAAGQDKTVWLWETATGNVLHKLPGHTATIRDLAFAPDGQKLVTVGDDGACLIWNTATGARLATLSYSPPRSGEGRSNSPPHFGEGLGEGSNHHPLTTIALSSNGRWIATGGSDAPLVRIWDAETYALHHSLDLGPAESVAFAPTAARLAIAGRDGFLRIAKPDQVGAWTVAATTQAHSDAIHDLAWSPDSAQLVTAGADRVVKLWDAETWQEKTTIGPFKEAVYSVGFSPDGRRVAAAARNSPVKVWDLGESQFVADLLGNTALTTSVDFGPAGWRLLSASEDGTVRIWDAAQIGDYDRLEGHFGHVKSLAFSPDGRLLATGDADRGSVTLWNPATSQPVDVYRPGAVNDLAFSPDGRYLASTHYDQHIRVRDLKSRAEVLDQIWYRGSLISCAFTPNGKHLAAQSADGLIQIVDVDSGSVIAPLAARHDRDILANIAFSPDGQLLAATCGANITRLWRTATHSLVHELHGHQAPVASVAFSPQGTHIATSSNDHTIRLWDVATGRHLRTLTGHAGTPFGLAFSPNGVRLASSSSDQTVKIWDVETGIELQSLSGHTHWARDVAFSPDGVHLATAGYDGTVRIWRAPLIPPPRSGQEPRSDSPPRSERELPSDSPPRSGEGLGEELPADLPALREATALVNHLMKAITTIGPPVDRATAQRLLQEAISSDATVSDAVLDAALDQVQESLIYWHPMRVGHRAAERQDWPAAVEAFEQVTLLAPEDVMHWHWLAMASVAAGRRDVYQRVCDYLAHHIGPGSSRYELETASRTWFVMPQDAARFKTLQPVLDAYRQRFVDAQSYLNYLRTGNPPSDIFTPNYSPTSVCNDPQAWYTFAIAYLRVGDHARAMATYRLGSRMARNGNDHWTLSIEREALRREFEALLAVEPSPSSDTPPPAIPITAPTAASPAGE